MNGIFYMTILLTLALVDSIYTCLDIIETVINNVISKTVDVVVVVLFLLSICWILFALYQRKSQNLINGALWCLVSMLVIITLYGDFMSI